MRIASGIFFCQGSERLSAPTAGGFCAVGARFLHAYSMARCGHGVVQGTAPNSAFSVRPAATVATWLLMVVAVVVWDPGIGFFAYGTVVGHRYIFCKEVGGINFAGFCRGRPDWGGAGVQRPGVGGVTGAGGKGGGTRRARAGWLNRLKRNAVAAVGSPAPTVPYPANSASRPIPQPG